MIARFRPDGFLDRQFGTNGPVTTQFDRGFRSQANAVTIDFRGRAVCAGVAEGAGSDIALARYQRNGQPDLTFGQQGRLTTQFNEGDSEARVVRIDSATEERVLVAGSAGGRFALVRYLNDGTLDTTFGDGGRVSTEIDAADKGSAILDLCVDGSGRIVAAGYSEDQVLE